MKSNILIIVVLVIALQTANCAPNKRQTEKIFKNLVSNNMGKDIFASIQLELSTSSNDTNIVDTILNMLYGLRDQYEENNQDAKEELTQKAEFCGEKIAGLGEQITDLNEKIAKEQATLPILEEAAQLKTIQANEQQAQIDNSNIQINEIHDKNTVSVETFNTSVEDHDLMIEALQKAKELISQLSATGFLQKNSQGSNKMFAQLKSHTETTLALLPNHQHRGVFKILVNLAQDVGVQADQSQVAEIIAIIDELMNFERETASVEWQAEQKRLERFNFDLTRANGISQQLGAQIKDLVADASTLNLKAKEINFDVKGWEESKNAKQEQLDLQQKTCDDSETSLNYSLISNTETLAVVQQVIDIFESEDIQDIKTVVGDIEY